MSMTQDEIYNFWKLNASLRNVPEDVSDPSILMARNAYENLKAKMLEQISKHGKAETANVVDEIKDPVIALKHLDVVLGAFISMMSVIPQLAGDPKTIEVIDNGKAASKWFHDNLDGLNKLES